MNLLTRRISWSSSADKAFASTTSLYSGSSSTFPTRGRLALTGAVPYSSIRLRTLSIVSLDIKRASFFTSSISLMIILERSSSGLFDNCRFILSLLSLRPGHQWPWHQLLSASSSSGIACRSSLSSSSSEDIRSFINSSARDILVQR